MSLLVKAKRLKMIVVEKQICCLWIHLLKWRALSRSSPYILTDLGHVQAVLLGGVVPAGGDGGHVHAVDLPYGRVAAVEVAAVGAGGQVVWTFMFGPLTVNKRSYITSPGLVEIIK